MRSIATVEFQFLADGYANLHRHAWLHGVDLVTNKPFCYDLQSGYNLKKLNPFQR